MKQIPSQRRIGLGSLGLVPQNDVKSLAGVRNMMRRLF